MAMNPDTPKHRFQQEQEQAAEQRQSSQQQTGAAFNSVEDLLRHDRDQTAAPPSIAERLKLSQGAETAPKLPWWRRWFMRSVEP